MENDDKYKKLEEMLENDFTWPNDYMFKFIVPFNADSLNELKSFFSKDAKISHKESKSGKYISFTATQQFDGPNEIIAIYKKAEKIKGIVSL